MSFHSAPSPLAKIRPEAARAPESGIVEVFNYGRDRPGLIPLWVGEGDLPTPSFIMDSAARALQAGETFYTHQRGIPPLRQAIADYMGRVYGRHFDVERFYVTIGGMQAIQLGVRMAAGTGDEVLIPSPSWPNFAGAVIAAGATPVDVPMALTPVGNSTRWALDIDRIASAITPRTKAIIINSPSNPTGWTATRDELAGVLAIAREHGLWIIADEIYGRIVFDGSARAPSFHDVMEDDDLIVFAQTFSKNWAMTGWRIGWLECNPALGQTVENLIQYSSSGVAQFLQRAAVTALEEGESFVLEQVARAKVGRDIVCNGLAATGRVHFAPPEGAFYMFFGVDGEPDTRKLAMRLVDDANVGLAPGTAFGTGAADYLRLCFARRHEDLVEATRRIAAVLTRG